MQSNKCSASGHETGHEAASPSCEHAANGAAKPKWLKPPPPPELAGLVITPVPPEMAEEFRRTFNEEEYLAGARELEQSGGVQIDDLIAELERRANGRV